VVPTGGVAHSKNDAKDFGMDVAKAKMMPD
jgi:hypothetical protein